MRAVARDCAGVTCRLEQMEQQNLLGREVLVVERLELQVLLELIVAVVALDRLEDGSGLGGGHFGIDMMNRGLERAT